MKREVYSPVKRAWESVDTALYALLTGLGYEGRVERPAIAPEKVEDSDRESA